MSLILEALKKSESQRKLGQAPDLGTPVMSTRHNSSRLPWFLALIVIVVVAGAWLYFAPAPAEKDASNVAAGAANNAANNALSKPGTGAFGNVAGGGAGNPSSTHAAAAPPRAAARTATAPAPPASTVAPPVATAPPHAVVPPASPPPASSPAVAAQSAKTPPAPAPAAPPAPNAFNNVAASTPAKSPPVAVTNENAAADSAQASALPSVYDLPYSTRRDLPELPISMEVYSPDAARRFIVVGGERKVEGDTIDKLALREIRVNGIVLEYQGQRFFLPRPGS